jgi:hemolysin III
MSVNAQGYTAGEERAHVATHALGTLLSAVGLGVLVWGRGTGQGALETGTGAVFGASLVLLYAASTLYHAASGPRLKHRAKLLDHASIYVLIAGTYTPFTLVTLKGPWGTGLFIAVWALAALGVGLEAFWVYRPKWLSAAVYLAMGWMVTLASQQLFARLPPEGLWLLFGGGLFYTLGTAFYVMKKVPYMHAVWHAFVLGGSICHFLSVALYVRPVPA